MPTGNLFLFTYFSWCYESLKFEILQLRVKFQTSSYISVVLWVMHGDIILNLGLCDYIVCRKFTVLILVWSLYCVKSLRIRNFSDPNFPAFGLNTERYGVSLRIQSECGKIRTRKTPNTDTFYAALKFAIHNKSQARYHRRVSRNFLKATYFHWKKINFCFWFCSSMKNWKLM